KLRRIIPCDAPHPRGARRPDSDLAILSEIAQHLDTLVAGSAADAASVPLVGDNRSSTR
ncbi:MAG: hypothetical protein RLZ45_1185, partial [Verrucomicrobiota bacterium]